MKSRHNKPQGNRPGTTNPNRPQVNLRVDEDFYVESFNTLVTSLVGPYGLKLRKLEDLPDVLDVYGAALSHARRESDVHRAFCYAQVVAWLKKLELPLFEDKARESALAKWVAAEAACADVNRKCLDLVLRPLTTKHTELQRVISVMAQDIQNLLGAECPDLPDVAHFMKFGPGASLTHAFDEGAAPFKLLNPSYYNGMEEELSWLYENTAFREVLFRSPLDACIGQWSTVESPKGFDEAEIAFVPKSVKELRTIELGPSLATFIQQGYDGFIRQRLKDRWGIDLTRQEPNQDLARIGSVMGATPNSPCTIDLSAASDRISYGVVGLLLPSSWFHTLKRYRAKSVVNPVTGDVTKLEKFSSMGNALTFSLQTLIFSAVVRSVLREQGWEGSRWRCYGDDIIVPYRAYDAVVLRLELLGFQVNLDKSFKEGNFRESCGVDFLQGTNVRPMYIKKPIKDVAGLYQVLNLIQLFADRAPIPASYFRTVFAYVLGWVPKEFLIFGEPRLGLDSCIWTPYGDSPLILRRRVDRQRVPDKLGYLVCLLNGYAPERIKDMTSAIHPHSPPCLERERGHVLRRPRILGRISAVIDRERLPFNAMLMT